MLTKQGTNTVTLTVTDSAGHTAQASEDFFIAGQYPQARFTWAPATVFAGEPIAFDGSASSDADGTIASYDWQWGDGTPDASTREAEHMFATPRHLPGRPLRARRQHPVRRGDPQRRRSSRSWCPRLSHAALTNAALPRRLKPPTAVDGRRRRSARVQVHPQAPAKVTSRSRASGAEAHAEGRHVDARASAQRAERDPVQRPDRQARAQARQLQRDPAGEQRQGQVEAGRREVHRRQVAITVS